jgi:GT2 family glycosyltransferase
VIIVDNALNLESVNKIKYWSKTFDPNGLSGTKHEVYEQIQNEQVESDAVLTYIVYNNKNKGYSAGNNIGVRLEEQLNMDVILSIYNYITYKVKR